MIVYRLASTEYKDDLTGEGARIYGGRWNSQGVSMLYATESISLAVLEIMVNKRMSKKLNVGFHLVELLIPDEDVKQLAESSLKEQWFDDISYTQFIGDHFLQDEHIWILKIPSAVIPEECNFIINPKHPKFEQLKLQSSRPYGLDNRLWGED